MLAVTWVGGPYDGASLELPDLYRHGQFIDLPDPQGAAQDAEDEPAIYMPSSHRYRLELTEDGAGLVARYEPG